jgi:hypothetical protein
MPKRNATEGRSVSLPGPMWGSLDEYCRRNDVSTSYALRRAVRYLLAVETAEDPRVWDQLYQDNMNES